MLKKIKYRILAGSALILMLMQYFGDKKIIESSVKFQLCEEFQAYQTKGFCYRKD